MFLPFLQVLIPTVVFFHESNYWKSIARFSNEQWTFLQEIPFTRFYIMRNYNHRRSSDKNWAQEGRLFRQKLSFSRVFLRWSWIFFSPIGLVSFIDPLHQKLAKAWCRKLPNFWNWHFSWSDPLKVWPPISPKFSRWPRFFFNILTTGIKGSIIPNSEGVPDVRD